MAEEVSTTPDNSATIAEKVEKTVENVEKTVEKSEEAAPKKKGRPAGAKDKAPRAKKPRVVVVEEPLEDRLLRNRRSLLSLQLSCLQLL